MTSSPTADLDLDLESATSTLSARPDYFSRRHTYAASMRPLRSSPLAGPSLALTHEGLLVGPPTDEDDSAISTWSAGMSSSACTSSTTSTSEHGARSRYRPSRIGSSPIPAATASASLPPTLRFLQPALPDDDDEPPNPTHLKAARRISLGRMKLKSMPTLPSTSAPPSVPTAVQHRRDSPSPSQATSARPRSILISPAHSTHSLTAVSPIPPTSTLASGSGSTRRPSTASSLGSSSTNVRRRSYLANQPPSTSRDPELNWMSATGPPRFSRQGLKEAGVVMPVSAREARRRSLPPSPPLTVPSMSAVAAGKMRERRQTLALAGKEQLTVAAQACILPSPTIPSPVASPTASERAVSPVPSLEPPAAPFAYGSPGSSTSSLSSGSQRGSLTSLTTLSRTASDASAMSMDSAPEEKGCGAVVVQVNGVPVEVVGLPQSNGKGASEAAERKKAGTPKGKGTLQRMWKRVVRSVGGR